MSGWDTSEAKLVSDIACMFFDAQTVKSVPSDYARSVIAVVREHDETKRRAANKLSGAELERFSQDDSGLPSRFARVTMDIALECERRLDALATSLTKAGGAP